MVRVPSPAAVAGVLVAAALALGACSDDPSLEAPREPGGSPIGGAAEARFEVSANEISPAELTVPFAAPVRLEIVSTDGRSHEVVLEDGLGPGEDATVEVPADGEGAADVGPFDAGSYALRLEDGEASATLVAEE